MSAALRARRTSKRGVDMYSLSATMSAMTISSSNSKSTISQGLGPCPSSGAGAGTSVGCSVGCSSGSVVGTGVASGGAMPVGSGVGSGVGVGVGLLAYSGGSGSGVGEGESDSSSSGVGSKLSQPKPSKYSSTHAWAFLPITSVEPSSSGFTR